MPTVLIADKMSPRAAETLAAAGLTVLTEPGLSEEELCERAARVEGIIVRSATRITAKVLRAGAGTLQIVGRAGVGVDNIDLAAATAHGVIVENTPFGNIISAAEHALALLLALARNVPAAHTRMLAGSWDKKSFTGVELDGKAIGIIGLGKVGAIVARVTRALGMDVLVYDPYLTDARAADLQVRKVELDELLGSADFVTVHTPLTDQTRGMLDAAAFAKMRQGVRVINAARGGIVDETALIEALESGHVAGAAVDVFGEEPYESGPLCRAPHVILTPHLGAATAEAQEKVAEQIADQFVAYFRDGGIQNAVNLSVTMDPALAPYAELGARLGAMLGQLTEGAAERLHVSFYGQVAESDTRQVALAVLKGMLAEGTDEPVSVVNAAQIAAGRGLRLIEHNSTERRNYVSLIQVQATTRAASLTAAGTLFEGRLEKIVNVNGYDVDLRPAEILLVMRYADRPGIVGKIGTILGDARVNIADMVVGRKTKGETALVILTLDDPVDSATLATIRDAIQPEFAKLVKLPPAHVPGG